LSAYALGIRNVLVLTGDYTTTGIVKSAKPVFDLDATNILVIAKKLEEGEDFSGKKLNKSPDFFLGAVFNPNLVPLEIEILKLLKKKKAGAEFFQTQLFFELSLMERVRDRVGDDVKIIAGVTIFKSLEMLEYMMDERVIEMFKNTKDIKALSIEFCVEFCSKLKESKLLDGIHFLASRPSDIIKVLDLLKW